MSAMISARRKSFGVYTWATPMASSSARSASGMMPPTTTGASTPAARELGEGLGHERQVRARQDRQAHHVDVFVAGRGRDLGRAEADALVHDLHARVAGRDRDLLGAVGVTVEAGLADEEPDRPSAGRLRDRPNVLADRLDLRPDRARDRADPGGPAVLAEHLAQRAGPLADGPARPRELDRRGHEVLGGGRDRAQTRERGLDRGVVAAGAPLAGSPRPARVRRRGRS